MGDVVQMRDYMTREEQNIRLNRIGNRMVEYIITGLDPIAERHTDTAPSEYTAPDGDCA